MEYIYASEEVSVLNLGYQGEQGVRTVRFPKLEGFTSASADYKRQGDTGYYEVALTGAGNYYEWTVGAYDVAMSGWGKVQCNYTAPNQKKKTITWDTKVLKSIEGTSTPTGYVDGDAIHINSGDRSINLLFDDEYFSLTDGNELTFNGADSQTKAFTTANIELITQEEGGGYNAGTYWQTKGETLSDTLRLNQGEFVFSVGQASTDDAVAVQLVMKSTEDITRVGYYDFYTDTATLGYAMTKLKVSTADDAVKIYAMQSGSTEWTLLETYDITDQIVHYQGFFRNYTGVSLVSASGSMTDPVYPLPHDARLDDCFATPGYATVGGKQFPLVDLTTQKQKAFDNDCISMSYNGTKTYVYDFYRRGYSMLYEGEKTPVRFTVNLNPDRQATTLEFGVYNCIYDESFTPISLGSYDETATGHVMIYSLRFEAEWSDTAGGFTPKWTACDINNHAVYSTPTVSSGYTGPIGVYTALPGYIENIYDFSYGIDREATGVYFLYDVEPNADFDYADTSRDILQVSTDDDFTILEGWGRGWGMFDNNHVLSNGYMILGCEDIEHTAGTWTLNIRNEYGEVEKTATFTESEGHMVERIYMTRDITGERAELFISDGTSQATQLYSMDRSTKAYFEVVYNHSVESMTDLFRYQWFSGVYEKIDTVPLADSHTYGMVRYDDDTLKVNDLGQLYANNIFIAEYDTTTYQEVLDAVLSGKVAIIYRLETTPDNQGEVYFCNYVGPHDCSFIYHDGNMFNETFTRVIKVDNQNIWTTYDRLSNAPLQAGTGINITKTLVDNKYKTVISLSAVDELEAKIAELEAKLAALEDRLN